jgi:hypothetical protein
MGSRLVAKREDMLLGQRTPGIQRKLENFIFYKNK